MTLVSADSALLIFHLQPKFVDMFSSSAIGVVIRDENNASLSFDIFAKGIDSEPILPDSIVPHIVIAQRDFHIKTSFSEFLPVSDDCRLLVPPLAQTFETSNIAVSWTFKNGILTSQASLKFVMPGYWTCSIQCRFLASNGSVTKEVSFFKIRSIDETEVLHSPDGLKQTIYDVFFGSRTITSRVSRFLETSLPFLQCMWQIDSVMINKLQYPFADFNITLNVPVENSIGIIFVACTA